MSGSEKIYDGLNQVIASNISDEQNRLTQDPDLQAEINATSLVGDKAEEKNDTFGSAIIVFIGAGAVITASILPQVISDIKLFVPLTIGGVGVLTIAFGVINYFRRDKVLDSVRQSYGVAGVTSVNALTANRESHISNINKQSKVHQKIYESKGKVINGAYKIIGANMANEAAMNNIDRAMNLTKKVNNLNLTRDINDKIATIGNVADTAKEKFQIN